MTRRLNSWSRFFVPLLLSVIAGQGNTQAPGTVLSHQKISDTEGGFTGILGNNDSFGSSTASLGDLDGDGVGDLAVGAYLDADGGTSRGAVWVLFLNTNGTVKSHQKISSTQGGFNGPLLDFDLFGSSVASLGDLDGDGVGDLAVGAIQDSDSGTHRGAVWVLFLSTDGTVKSHQKITGMQGGFTGTLDDLDAFGNSVASLGDLDGDGVRDLAVGALFDDDGGTNRGAVWMLFLNTDGTVKSHQKISSMQGGFNGMLEDVDVFGASVASLGDLDGDGVGDIAIGASLNNAVWVLFLNTNGTVKAHQKISSTEGGFTGTLVGGELFGSSVASLGDLSGDGVGDLAVGAYLDGDGGLSRGAVWVLFLNANGMVNAHQKISDTQGAFTGTLDDRDSFGYSLAPMGDFDSDGVADLAAGAYLDGDGGGGRGAVWLLFLDGIRPMASAAIRNGTGVNAVCYTNLTPPVLGTTWDTQIDHSGHIGANTTLIVGKAFPTSVTFGLGELLIRGPKFFKDTVISSGTADTHSLFIPSDVSLAGIVLSTQALILGGGLELCNAIDLVVGF